MKKQYRNGIFVGSFSSSNENYGKINHSHVGGSTSTGTGLGIGSTVKNGLGLLLMDTT